MTRSFPVHRVWLGCGMLAAFCLGIAGCNEPPEPTPTTSEREHNPSSAPDPAARDQSSGPKQSTLTGDRLGAVVVPAKLNTHQDPSPFRFSDIVPNSGIDFVHFSGMTAEKHFPSANGSGAAVFDYDGDGKLDLYFATCTLLPLGKAKKGPNRLYKNLGKGKFQDATESSGLGFAGFCHGIVVGDVDNDGDPDVFLCNYGPNVLYRNNGNGTFTDISKEAGIDKPAWSSGGAFLDYDNDGDLDLYVANYGEWKLPDDDQFCGDKEKNIRFYCSPRSIRTAKHILYRNEGNGKFTDVTDQAGVGRTDGHGFGVVTADLDGDGKIDIYVATDMNPHFLFLNNGDGTFRDATEVSGAAFDERGQATSGMGVDAEDINGDGRPDLFVTNFQNEPNTLFENQGEGSFIDTTAFVGLAADSMPWVGWGCALADFDNDGWPDAFVTNGHVDDNRHALGQEIDYEEPALLHHNVPVGKVPQGPSTEGEKESRRFKLATRDVGPYFNTNHVGRGAAFGDIDDDGDIDIVINHKDGAPAVLRNDTPTKNHWIRLKLVGTKSNRDAIGALVKVEVENRTITRQRKGGCSMESANDPRLLIGVGSAQEILKLTIRWPSGKTTTREHVPTNQTFEITEE